MIHTSILSSVASGLHRSQGSQRAAELLQRSPEEPTCRCRGTQRNQRASELLQAQEPVWQAEAYRSPHRCLMLRQLVHCVTSAAIRLAPSTQSAGGATSAMRTNPRPGLLAGSSDVTRAACPCPGAPLACSCSEAALPAWFRPDVASAGRARYEPGSTFTRHSWKSRAAKRSSSPPGTGSHR